MTVAMAGRKTVPLDELLKLPADEWLKYDETPSIEELRTKQQLYFDDVEVGLELPKYIRRRSIVEMQRWSITMENTHRLHYDYPHAVNHDKLPGVLFHGSWRISIIAAWLKNWALPDGWLWKYSFQVRSMVVAGETTLLWGKVTDKREQDGMGLVQVQLGMIGEGAGEGAPGKATVALPIRGGRTIPYPFVPPKA
jgi:acyl dehydratase